MDAFTVLVCAPGYSATKTHTKSLDRVSTQGFNAGMYFASMSIPVSGIKPLSKTLESLESQSSALAIRGALQPNIDPTQGHQRTKYEPCNYLTPPQGRRYAMVDIDKLALPDGLRLTKRTVNRVIAYVIRQLPAEFHNASFHWQLSSSAGIGDPTKISIHLWFWFDRPIADQDLKRWGNAVNAAKGFNLIDVSLFNDVQAHYTAAPIFKGMPDPIPMRSGLVEKEQHEVSLVLPAPSAQYPKSSQKKNRSLHEVHAGQGFEYHLSTIGDHPGGQGFHAPVLSATASHVATLGGENVDKEWLFETVRDAVLAADCSRHSQEEVESRASHEHIMAAIEGAIEKFGQHSERKPRLYDGIEPHYQSTPLTKQQADKKLERALAKYF